MKSSRVSPEKGSTDGGVGLVIRPLRKEGWQRSAPRHGGRAIAEGGPPGGARRGRSSVVIDGVSILPLDGTPADALGGI